MTSKNPIFGEFCPADDAKIILYPVPFDATASYHRGTHLGPKAILEASDQIDLLDHHFGDCSSHGIHMLEHSTVISSLNTEATTLCDATRDTPCADQTKRINEIGHLVNTQVEKDIAEYLGQDKIVGVIGGDHSCPFALMAAYADRHPGLGILHIDAHADLRHCYEGFDWSHASIMRNVFEKTKVEKIVQVGIRDYCEEEQSYIKENNRIVTFFDQDLADERLRGETFSGQCSQILAALPQQVYISLDIDGLDPSLAPSTGTPVPGGLHFRELSFLLKALATSGKEVVGFDLCEVAPGPSEWDANVGMRVLYKLCGSALLSQNNTAPR